ncbi:MAG TPA: polysaccharide deacetylase family protein [Firmicutes bacterium]|jgi:peptidoglycan-N-acetylglucosamine deacetylase|nr:polysaccharide deacetylase family protein [Bacillota bacterium]
MANPYLYGYKLPINKYSANPFLAQKFPQLSSFAQQPYITDPNQEIPSSGNIFYHGPTNKLAALTFDDVPDSLFAPILLEILARYDVKATFFALGKCAHQNSSMVGQIVQKGHIIGNHTYDHLDITKISAEQVREQILRTEEEIYQIAGVRTALFRPPFGFFNDTTMQEIIAMGYKIIMWNIDSYDWMGLTGPAITSRVIVNIKPGAIVLMHNACDGSIEAGTGTVQSLPFIIETLKSAGYVFASIPTMLGIPAYK